MTIVGNKVFPDGHVPGTERDPKDPPVFILLASPTWAPWLPDTSFQKVPIGGTGQVLTVQADGSVNWQNSAAGFSNPMTTVGDIIIEGAGPTPARLAIGTAGQVLTVAAGLPSWQNSAAGFSNPMTTTGDLISSSPGSTPVRVGIGSSGQVLTVAGGVPTWQNATGGGFANPMTTSGDLIVGGLAGVASRLGIGSTGQVLTVVSGTPAWVAGAAGPASVVFPSGDTSGVTDRNNIVAAYPGNGGEVLFAPGSFYVKPSSGLNCLSPPAQTTAGTSGGNPVCFRGVGAATTLFPVGAGVTGIYYHRASGYGAQFGNPAQKTTGFMRDFVIDGTNTSGASVGLNIGDGWGYETNLRIVNFDTANAIGFIMRQDVFWCEKGCYRLQLMNNTQAALFSSSLAPGGDISNEYNDFYINMFCNTGQQGIVVDGSNMGGSRLYLWGNMALTSATGSSAPPGNIAMLTLVNAIGATLSSAHRWYQGQIWAKVEGNPGDGSGTVYPYGIYSDGVGYVRECTGHIAHSLGNPNVSGLDSNLNGAEFSFGGITSGDSYLSELVPTAPGSPGTKTTAFTVPATGVAQQNYAPNALVCVSGGTVSGISVNGNATGLTSGPFTVPSGGSITFTYTVAPTVNWVNIGQNNF